MFSCDDIKPLRKRMGITQMQFGRLFGVSSRTILRWETNQAFPTSGQVDIFSNIFQIAPEIDLTFVKKSLIFEGVPRTLHKLLKYRFGKDIKK